MAAGADRESSLTSCVDKLVTKHRLALKGEEEILTADNVLLKDGLWRRGCSQAAYLNALVNGRSHTEGCLGLFFFLSL